MRYRILAVIALLAAVAPAAGQQEAAWKGKNLQYVFRPQVHTDQYGAASCSLLNETANAS